MEPKRHCPHCGARAFEDVSRFCHECGKELKHATHVIGQAVHKYHIVRDLVFLLLGIAVLYGLFSLYTNMPRDISVDPEVAQPQMQTPASPIIIQQPTIQPETKEISPKASEDGNVQDALSDDLTLDTSKIVTIGYPPGSTGRRFLDVKPTNLEVDFGDTIAIKSEHWDTYYGLHILISEFITDPKLGYGAWSPESRKILYPGEVIHKQVWYPTRVRIKNRWQYYDQYVYINALPT